MKTFLLMIFSVSVYAGGVPVSTEVTNGVQEVYDAIIGENGQVNYPLLKERKDLQDKLNNFVAYAATVDLDAIPGTNAKIAMLSNAYNVFTLVGVNRAWPVESVRKIRALFGFFTKDNWVLAGQKLSLNDLEKKHLRHLDPRIHFVINCASGSCPVLLKEVLTADNVEAQMEKAARDFLADETKNRFDRAEKRWYLSKIFKWYEDDWGKQADVVAFIRKYRPDLEWEPKKISYLDYDWSLNGPTQ